MDMLIAVGNLVLDPQNARLDPTAHGERYILDSLLRELGEKIVELALDIAKVNLNPSEMLIVMPSEGGRYIVLEGNRRLAALKLLRNPELGDHQLTPAEVKRIRQAANRWKPIENVRCCVMSSRSEAAPWIERKHTGEREGVGVVRWDPRERARFETVMLGQPDVTLQVYDFVLEHGELDIDTRRKMHGIKFSNLQRMIEDAAVRRVLGIEVDQRIVLTTLAKDEVRKGLCRIVREVLKPEFSVTRIEDAPARLALIQSFGPDELPSASAPSGNAVRLADAPETLSKALVEPSAAAATSPGQTPAASGSATGVLVVDTTSPPALPPRPVVPTSGGESPGAAPPQKPRPPSSQRKTLIPKRTILIITEARINNIYHELRHIPVETYPNAVSALYRVFLELSADVFIRKLRIKHVTEQSKLHDKLFQVVEYMKEHNHMTKKDLVPATTLLDKGRGLAIGFVPVIHEFLHNPAMNPLPTDLMAAWDNMEGLVATLWTLLVQQEQSQP